MMSYRARTTNVALGLVLLALGAGCSSVPTNDPDLGTGGSSAGGAGGSKPATGGTTGATGGSSGSGQGGATGGATGGSSGSGGSGGASETGGSGGTTEPDAAAEGGQTGADADQMPTDATTTPGGPLNFGGVGQLPLVPLQHTPAPIPPILTPACNDPDPTQGFTEYEDSFVVQRPQNLPASDRVKYEGGIYTFWVKSGDLSHKPDSSTEPRTEARYSDMSTGELIWTGDVMFESPSKTCIFQIHNVNSPIAIYLRVVGDRMFNLSTGTTIATGMTGKWFNLKVAFNIATRQVRTFINGCLKETSTAPNTASVNKWYFKHGVYTCDSGTCTSHYKNIHLFQKGSTDKFNMKSTYP
jgi:hypothetical protein